MKTWGVLILSLFTSSFVFGQISISGKIYNSENFAIFGDVKFVNAQIENTKGKLSLVAVRNAHEVSLENSLFNGLTEIGGGYRTLMNVSKSCHVGELLLNKNKAFNKDADLYIFAETNSKDSLIVEKALNLQKGLVFNNDKVTFEIANTEKSSIAFNDTSYVIGNLQRKTAKGIEYELPIGDDRAMHLMTVSDNHYDKNTYSIGFTNGLPAEVQSTILQLSRRGYWEVSAEKPSASDLKTYYKNMDLLSSGSPNFLKVSQKDDGSFEQQLLNVASIDYNELSLKVNTEIDQKKAKFLVAEHTESNAGWINFIDLNSSDTRFIIRDINTKYTKINIAIYNSWGREVYKSTDYQNDFDARSYPAGTYFYRACYTMYGSGEEICKNSFFEVKD